jgi:hypothetical protein
MEYRVVSDSGRREATPAVSNDAEWLARLDVLGEERGYFQKVGPRHSAVFTDEGPILLVTFESIAAIRARDPDGVPEGFALADAHGWSHLALVAHHESWFRDPAVYGYFDRLIDEGFFEDFDRVILYGTGMGAYAACAYSVVAPGSVVVTVAPQATLDRRIVEWDDRFPQTRRMSFGDRYGFAPLMVEAADEVYLFYDPAEKEDAMHASLFASSHVEKIRCPRFGATLAEDLRLMRVMPEVLELAGRGRLTARAVHRLMRVRHRYAPYLRSCLKRLVQRRRPWLTGLLCRSAVRRGGGRLFQQHLESAEAELAVQGRTLPPPRLRRPVSQPQH